MKILEKRPLALILCILLGGFSFFADCAWQAKLTIALVSFLAIGVIYTFDNLKHGRKPLVVISLLAFGMSPILSLLWSVSFYPNNIYDTNAQIEAKIYDIDYSSASVSLRCETEKINGKRDKHIFYVYLSKDEATTVRKYDVISFSADVKPLSSSDDGFDGKMYYASNGYSAVCSNVSDLTVIKNSPDRLDDLLDNLRLKICNTLKMRTNFDTGAFLSALIVGEREDLSGNVRLNFARLGISHILALSGMHLAILSVAVNLLLIKIGIRKKARVSILAVLVLFYMGLTGFSPSVLRSGIMLMISGLLYLLATKSDALTSLVIAVTLIVIFDPISIYDTSLWLSAFATLGVIVFSEIAEKPDKLANKWNKMWILFKNACLVSVFAICATFVFTMLRYDEFSVVSVLTTIIFAFIIQFFIYAGLLLLIFGGIVPFGKLIILFSDGIMWLAERISSIRLVCVSMNFFAVKLLVVLLTVFFFAFLLLDIKNKRKGVLIICLMLVLVFVTAQIHTLVYRYTDDVVYAPSTSGDIILLKNDGDVSAIYSGKAYADDAWDILDRFTDEKLTYLDNLVFASYSYSMIDFAQEIIDKIKVERLMLPVPSTEDEIAQAEGISYLLSGYGTRLEFYGLLEYVDLGECSYRLFEKADYKYGEYPSNVFEIVANEKRYTYLSTCKYEELSASAKALIFNSENLMIGTVGNSNYYIFDMRLSCIQSIYYYDDGRLTDEAASYYKEKGALVRCIKSSVSLMD